MRCSNVLPTDCHRAADVMQYPRICAADSLLLEEEHPRYHPAEDTDLSFLGRLLQIQGPTIDYEAGFWDQDLEVVSWMDFFAKFSGKEVVTTRNIWVQTGTPVCTRLFAWVRTPLHRMLQLWSAGRRSSKEYNSRRSIRQSIRYISQISTRKLKTLISKSRPGLKCDYHDESCTSQ